MLFWAPEIEQVAEYSQQRYSFLREPVFRSVLPEPSFAETVLLKHAEARKSSAKLLYDLIHMSKPQTPSARGKCHSHRQQAEVISSGWWAWLERLEGELMEQKVYILPYTQTDRVADLN